MNLIYKHGVRFRVKAVQDFLEWQQNMKSYQLGDGFLVPEHIVRQLWATKNNRKNSVNDA